MRAPVLALLAFCLARSAFGEAPASPPAASPVLESANAELLPVVSDLRRLHAWRGRWYNAAGTKLLMASSGQGWTEYASLPDRVNLVQGASHSLAACGRDFLWVKPPGKTAEPNVFTVEGDWVALFPGEEDWVALSAQGRLAVFRAGEEPTLQPLGHSGKFVDLTRAWDQWWVVGQDRGEALLLTATSLAGPWTDASPGSRAPLVRVTAVGEALLAFAADGRVYRAIEGEAWRPVSGLYQAIPEPPLFLARTEREGLVTLSSDALRQTLDGLHWNVLPYPVDEYTRQALVATDFGIVLASLPTRPAENPLLLEPATPLAAFHLAQAYASGDGVPLEVNHAVDLFRQAAEAGLSRARLELAFLIASEQVKGADPKEASALFLGLAGLVAEPTSPTEATQRIEARALQGHGEAQGLMAVLCRLGFGRKASSVEATAWMTIAEEKHANLYALEWYQDVDDPAPVIGEAVASLRARLQSTATTSAAAP